MTESNLTKSEYRALETLLAHAKDKRQLDEVLMRFNPNALDRMLRASQKIVAAFEKIGWQPSTVSPVELMEDDR